MRRVALSLISAAVCLQSCYTYESRPVEDLLEEKSEYIGSTKYRITTERGSQYIFTQYTVSVSPDTLEPCINISGQGRRADQSVWRLAEGYILISEITKVEVEVKDTVAQAVGILSLEAVLGGLVAGLVVGLSS